MMEKNRQTKVIAIIALVVAVVGMSLGFAAFSNILTISSSATVTPNKDDFKVVLSGCGNDPYCSTIEAVVDVGHPDATAEDAVIVNEDGKSSTSLKVGFTEPGQRVSYDAHVHNVGAYVAYWNKLEFGNITGTEVKKVCTPVGNATPDLVAAACASIELRVLVGDYTFKDTTAFNDMALESGKQTIFRLEVEYLADGARADGPFTVEFGDLTSYFSTVN